MKFCFMRIICGLALEHGVEGGGEADHVSLHLEHLVVVRLQYNLAVGHPSLLEQLVGLSALLCSRMLV